jgi:excisionase family DNA binding protein
MNDDTSRVLLRPEEAAQRLGIGRTQLFRLLKDGHLESIRVGRLRRIPVGALQRFVDGRSAP